MMLTAKGSEYDKVLGLDSGADDYLAKPFGMMELIARVKALLRRNETSAPKKEAYRLGSLYVSPKEHIVKVDDKDISLTLKEYDLLCFLLKNRGWSLRGIRFCQRSGAMSSTEKAAQWTFTFVRCGRN